jgi:DNA-binding NarL/FixJ family response regulator
MTIQVVVADDADLTLAGIQVFLTQQSQIQLRGSYQRFSALLASITQSCPDVILLGDRLEPDLNALSLVERVRAAAPAARIILLSHVPDGLVVHELLNSGLAGYLYKSDPLGDDLLSAIQVVMRGRPYLSATVNAEYLLALQAGRLAWQLDTEAREVLQLLAQGYRPQEIALQRGVPVRRIYWVNTKLRNRFGAETNEHLIARAAEEGFLV